MPVRELTKCCTQNNKLTNDLTKCFVIILVPNGNQFIADAWAHICYTSELWQNLYLYS